MSNLVRLLDLPDEVIDLLQSGALTEGHGRALLLAEDHGARRALAREAAGRGWSVRATEERARASNETVAERPSRDRGAHPDQEQAAAEIAEALSGALGAEVRVRASRRRVPRRARVRLAARRRSSWHGGSGRARVS